MIELVLGYLSRYKCGPLNLGSDKLLQSGSGHRLGSLQRKTQSSVPHQAGSHSQCSGDSKQNSVIVHLLHAIVLEEDTRVGIYVGPWVLDLASLEEDGRHQHVQLRHKLEQFVIGKMFQGKFSLAGVSWISFAENSVSVSGNNLSGLQKAPDEVLHLIICGVQTDRLDDLLQEDQDLLVGEAVERTREAAHTSAEGQIWVREGRSHQVGGVGRYIATLVVTVDCQIKSHKFSEHFIFVSNHLGEVVRPILVGINGTGCSAISVQVVVDGGGDHRQLGHQVHGVLECGLPVLGLVNSLAIGLGELGLRVESGHGSGELGHGVEVGGEVVQHGDDMGGELCPAGTALGPAPRWGCHQSPTTRTNLQEVVPCLLGLWGGVPDILEWCNL